MKKEKQKQLEMEMEMEMEMETLDGRKQGNMGRVGSLC